MGVDAANGPGIDFRILQGAPHGAHDGWLVGAGKVVRVGGPTDASHLGARAQPMRRDGFVGGQNQSGGAFGQHEAAAVDAERAGGLRRIGESAIGWAQLEAGVHVGEAEHDFRDEGHFHAADHREIGVSVAHHARTQGDGVVARGACPLRREDRTCEAQHRTSLASGHVGADVGQQEGADAIGPDALEAQECLAQTVRAVDGRSDEARRARPDHAVHGDPGVGEGVLAHDHGFEHVVRVPAVPFLGCVERVGRRIAIGGLANDRGGPNRAARQLAQAALIGIRSAPGLLGAGAESGAGGPANDVDPAILGRFHE